VNSSLKKKFDLLEVQRKTLLHSLQSQSAEKLSQQPAGKWSINQVIAHLITAERLSLAYLKKKIQAVDEVEDTGLIEELKMIALIISQRLPFKFKAPKMVVENTPQPKGISQLELEWEQVRNELKSLLETIKDHQINRKIYNHVVAGKLNIKQTLIFFSEHIIHHQPQINRLL
jgi:uncharacterized damage-inducible protein DinB